MAGDDLVPYGASDDPDDPDELFDLDDDLDEGGGLAGLLGAAQQAMARAQQAANEPSKAPLPAARCGCSSTVHSSSRS
jgi:hypothetical protein